MKISISYKKSILMGIGFFISVIGWAQDSTAIMALLAQKDFARAKEAADNLVQREETATNLLLQAIVYDSIANNPISQGLVADARWQAFQQLQKAAANNNEYISKNAEGVSRSLFNGMLTEGLVYFNNAVNRNDKKGFETAFVIFKKAASINNFLFEQKLEGASLNNLLLSYLAKTAVYAEKEADAVFYCRKIADEKDELYKQNQIIYQWLVYYYSNKKDGENLNKYLNTAKAIYPIENYFLLTEIDWLRQQGDYNNLLLKYKNLLAKEPTNRQYKMAYCKDLFISIWKKGEINASAYRPQAIELSQALTELMTYKDQSVQANLLLAKVYINQAQDLLNEYMMRSTISVEIKKTYAKRRKDLLIKSNKCLNKIIADKLAKTMSEGKEAIQLVNMNNTALKGLK